jgi:hypothetical protein
VVKKTIRDVGNAQFPTLTRTNYAEWEVLVKVMFKARGLWKAVDVGTEDEEEDQLAMEGILKAVPPEYRVALGNKGSAKEAWDALKTMRLGGDRAREAKAQQVRRDYDALEFKDGEAAEDFALRLTGMVTELGVLGAPVTERDAVRKFLRVVPERYSQVAISIETCLQMEDLTIEDVSGRLKAAEDRYSSRAVKTATAVANAKLLLAAQEERALQLRGREAGEGSSAPRNRGGCGRVANAPARVGAAAAAKEAAAGALARTSA